MASKENAERKELHRKIWAIADDVRGAVDGWDFKQYILGILFYRFISEHMADYFDHAEHEAGDLEFRYAELSDQEAEQDFKPGTVEDKGFFILPSQLFENVVKNASQNENLNEDLVIFSKTLKNRRLDSSQRMISKAYLITWTHEATSLVVLFKKKINAFLIYSMVSIVLTLATLRKMTLMPLAMPMSS